jgi:hypothetical protein
MIGRDSAREWMICVLDCCSTSVSSLRVIGDMLRRYFGIAWTPHACG